MRPELANTLQGVTRTNVLFEAEGQSLQIAIQDPQAPNGVNLITHQAQDLLRVAPGATLRPEAYGFALLPRGETITLDIEGNDQHTQVILEEHPQIVDLLQYRIVANGVAGHTRILNRPAILGKNPQFYAREGKVDNIAIAGAGDDVSLYLCPGLDPYGQSGFFVVNASEQNSIGVRSSFAESHRVSMAPDEMPTVRMTNGQPPQGRRPEHASTSQILSGAAVESKDPTVPSEDRMLVKRQPTSTLLLADGMGGHGHGELAANEAIRVGLS